MGGSEWFGERPRAGSPETSIRFPMDPRARQLCGPEFPGRSAGAVSGPLATAGEAQAAADVYTGLVVDTPAGAALVTVERIERGAAVGWIEPSHLDLSPCNQGGPIRGTAMVCRSHVESTPDVFMVYVRADHGHGWVGVTQELTEDQARRWPGHAGVRFFPSPRMDAWLAEQDVTWP